MTLIAHVIHLPERTDRLQHFLELAAEKEVECFIVLNGGLRSSKRITYEDQLWNVYNEIDDTEQEGLTDLQLKQDTNIVEAIEQNALYEY